MSSAIPDYTAPHSAPALEAVTAPASGYLHSTARSGRQRWDIYCRVVDNLGDVGVCWRLAKALCGAGQSVRLVIDDPSALRWLASAESAGAEVQVHRWPGPGDSTDLGDVVIEAFGCTLPPSVLQALQALQEPSATPPIWLNLEYLSAEPYVEASHGLLSPQHRGPPKWFFYPGFSPRTGGLLREPELQERQAGFDKLAWLQAQGIEYSGHQKLVSVFCYANDQLPAFLASLAGQAGSGTPKLLLATAALPAVAQQMLTAAVVAHPELKMHQLPLLSQQDFDHLLWASDFNLVRGEDSLVRALWAAKPFLWQAYVQHDQAHHAKVLALWDWLSGLCSYPGPAAESIPDATADETSLKQVGAAWRAWNGLPGCPWPGLPMQQGDGELQNWQGWQALSRQWRSQMWQQSDLLSRLLSFVRSRR